MPRQIASELRASAARLRELASEGSYLGMGDALRQVAAEFEAEAKGVVAPSLPNESAEAVDGLDIQRQARPRGRV